MKKLTVNVGKTYEIIIEKGIMQECGAYIKKVSSAKKVCVITDSNVAPLYLDRVVSGLEKEGYEVFSFIFKAGESSKTTAVIVEMVEFLAEKGLTRKDLVVALGGGVCGDMAGFAAAVYLRGIDFVQIPTTLLSQVDSSVGGKTGVDLPQGKNLCGAFHQPVLVLIDPLALHTLSDHYFSDGMGEVIKAGCIKSAQLFEKIENKDVKENIEEIIFECVDIKRGVVERDEKEQGERALLNFGHTIGHGIEKLHNFSGVSHGEAVGIGMLMISEIGEKAGLTEKGTADRIKAVLEKYNMKTSDNHSAESIIEAMQSDKKRTLNGINFVMLKSIGNSFIYPVENEKINKLFGL
ncbi:3-dehydroquinate synthase [Clostridiales bacterium]|nr:3-dehydroquinate synthase [Clostridiales bacterium]